MSTKSTLELTQDDEHIYFDCSTQFESNGLPAQELSFEISKKNCRIDINDDEFLCFSLHRDSEIYRILVAALMAIEDKEIPLP